jgi:hypothetical protein
LDSILQMLSLRIVLALYWTNSFNTKYMCHLNTRTSWCPGVSQLSNLKELLHVDKILLYYSSIGIAPCIRRFYDMMQPIQCKDEEALVANHFVHTV